MSDEINEKTIALAVSTEKMTARVLRDVLLAYLRHRGRKSRYKATVLNKGKYTLKDLKKTNAELTSIEILCDHNGIDVSVLSVSDGDRCLPPLLRCEEIRLLLVEPGR